MARTPSKLVPTAARRRGGFTLIELMVAISIILILVAISIAGISQLSKHTKTQRTMTALETAKSLMAGYAASDSSQAALKSLCTVNTQCRLDPTKLADLTMVGTGASGGPQFTVLNAAKGPNGKTDLQSIQAADTSGDLVRGIDFTNQVMQLFLRVPENKAVMDKLPAEAKFILVDGTSKLPLATLLADGNGEPILFVPPGGLNKVTLSSLGSGSAGILQYDGRLHPTSGTDPFPNPLPTPFWVAAGADRDFTTGDDNAYSFHQ